MRDVAAGSRGVARRLGRWSRADGAVGGGGL